VTTRVRVSLGSEQSDRPHWLSVSGAALGGLVCGLLLMLALGRSLGGDAPSAPAAAAPIAKAPKPAAAAPADTATSAAAATAAVASGGTAGGGAPEEVAPPPATESEPVAATTVALPPAEAEPTPSAEPAPPPPPTAASPTTSVNHQLVRGQIAYLRCEGVPLEEGPFPCPRDRRFEKQVWAALERLQQCPLPALGSSGNDVELRIEFRTRGRHSFEVRPADGSEALAGAAHACLARDLELVRTQLRPLLMTVAFRFELH
jgi:hypothetical protein